MQISPEMKNKRPRYNFIYESQTPTGSEPYESLTITTRDAKLDVVIKIEPHHCEFFIFPHQTSLDTRDIQGFTSAQAVVKDLKIRGYSDAEALIRTGLTAIHA